MIATWREQYNSHSGLVKQNDTKRTVYSCSVPLIKVDMPHNRLQIIRRSRNFPSADIAAYLIVGASIVWGLVFIFS